MTTPPYIIIDFDAVFLKGPALEEMARMLFQGPDANQKMDGYRQLQRQEADGEFSFTEALRRKIAYLQPKKEHLPLLIERLNHRLSPSIVRNKAFFETYHHRVFILSSGFRDYIVPVVSAFHISPDHVWANDFVYDAIGNITGFDESNPLSSVRGKAKTLTSQSLDGEVVVIGDELTHYQVKASGLSYKFYAYTENVLSERIAGEADGVLPSFDEFLYVNQLPMAISFPKSRIKVLLLENVHPRAKAIFEEEGYQVETHKGAMSEEELCEAIKGVSILGIRSKTNVTQKVLEHANRLMAIGAFCIGTNQIDLEACAERGIIAFNAPFSNTRSVVELAIGQMILLLRRIPVASEQLHKGKWVKSAAGSYEIRGKKLGIVGYGNIGSQLSVLAEALGMNVHYYDVVEKLALGNATRMPSMEALLDVADVITIHVDGRKENYHLIGAPEFARMKPGTIFLNLSRGHVVDIVALRDAIVSGRVAGAAVDVFPEEPKTNTDPFESELCGLENVILTPHIGGSTEEAQFNIAEYVPARMLEYVNTGSSFNAVNFPNLQLPKLRDAHRLIHIHHNVPGILAKINQILATHGINIVGQYLKTDERIGYVITDINRQYDPQVLQDLRAIDHTIKFRALY
jgi:D-3-phosphoglycerate dehydrogenase